MRSITLKHSGKPKRFQTSYEIYFHSSDELGKATEIDQSAHKAFLNTLLSISQKVDLPIPYVKECDSCDSTEARYHKAIASHQQVAMARKTRALSATVLANEADDDISKLAFKNN